MGEAVLNREAFCQLRRRVLIEQPEEFVLRDQRIGYGNHRVGPVEFDGARAWKVRAGFGNVIDNDQLASGGQIPGPDAQAHIAAAHPFWQVADAGAGGGIRRNWQALNAQANGIGVNAWNIAASNHFERLRLEWFEVERQVLFGCQAHARSFASQEDLDGPVERVLDRNQEWYWLSRTRHDFAREAFLEAQVNALERRAGLEFCGVALRFGPQR